MLAKVYLTLNRKADAATQLANYQTICSERFRELQSQFASAAISTPANGIGSSNGVVSSNGAVGSSWANTLGNVSVSNDTNGNEYVVLDVAKYLRVNLTPRKRASTGRALSQQIRGDTNAEDSSASLMAFDAPVLTGSSAKRSYISATDLDAVLGDTIHRPTAFSDQGVEGEVHGVDVVSKYHHVFSLDVAHKGLYTIQHARSLFNRRLVSSPDMGAVRSYSQRSRTVGLTNQVRDSAGLVCWLCLNCM